jgi:hypothetical protein
VEFIFQFIFELLLQVVVEGVFSIALGRVAADRPVVRVVLFLALGTVAGGVSLLIFPNHLISHRSLRYAGIVLAPIVVGYVMAQIGRVRANRGKEPRGLEHFVSGWGFAFTFGAVRILCAQ